MADRDEVNGGGEARRAEARGGGVVTPAISARRVLAVEGTVYLVVAVLVVVSAILTKEARLRGESLVSLVRLDTLASVVVGGEDVEDEADEVPGGAVVTPIEVATPALEVNEAIEFCPADMRWFDGRPVRPARVMLMTVTGYSPDERSCGEYADGQTATLHSVWTNGMRLVAADTSVLPYGSMLTVPGYADDSIVPVLDRGGAIKGARLDVLFATHEQALAWGVREVPVVVWGYADGEPAPNPREKR